MNGKKYSIKEGVLFRPYGERSLITNDQLTNEMAEMFLRKDPTLLGSVIVENKKAETKKVQPKKVENKKNKK